MVDTAATYGKQRDSALNVLAKGIQRPKKLPASFWGMLKVYDTVARKPIWDHNIRVVAKDPCRTLGPRLAALESKG